MIRRSYFEQLGKLLYAMLNSDGRIQVREISAVERHVHQVLDRHPGFETDKNAELKDLMLTFLVFSNAVRGNEEVHGIVHSFKNFMSQHGGSVKAYDREIGTELLRAAALAYGGIRPEEQEMIDLLNEKSDLSH